MTPSWPNRSRAVSFVSGMGESSSPHASTAVTACRSTKCLRRPNDRALAATQHAQRLGRLELLEQTRCEAFAIDLDRRLAASGRVGKQIVDGEHAPAHDLVV